MSRGNFRGKRTSLCASGLFLLKFPLKATNLPGGLSFFRRNAFAGLRFRTFLSVRFFREGPAGWARRFHRIVKLLDVAFVGEVRVDAPRGRRKSHSRDSDFFATSRSTPFRLAQVKFHMPRGLNLGPKV